MSKEIDAYLFFSRGSLLATQLEECINHMLDSASRKVIQTREQRDKVNSFTFN
jgi:hypothetical protein